MDCCSRCRLIGETWGLGDVELGEVNKDSASYIAGYTVKKMTAPDDIRLRGRYPEFPRMSLRPGIGADAMWDVASKLLRSLSVEADVPYALRQYGKLHPIGRYLRQKLRTYVGRDPSAPEWLLKELEAELSPLRDGARVSETQPSFKKAVIEAGQVQYDQLMARNAIYKKERKL